MRTALTLALVTATFPALATAQTLSASDPAGIVAAMQTAGYRAELTTDSGGDPKINSSAGGSDFLIYFYGCTANKDCDSIALTAGFDLVDGTTLDVVNGWNAEKRYGKAYLDDEMDPFLELDINMHGGGIPQAAFLDTIDIWEGQLGEFTTLIDF